MKNLSSLQIGMRCVAALALVAMLFGPVVSETEAGWLRNRIRARRAMRQAGVGGPVQRWVAPVASYQAHASSQSFQQSQQAPQQQQSCQQCNQASNVVRAVNVANAAPNLRGIELAPGERLVSIGGVAVNTSSPEHKQLITYPNCQGGNCPLNSAPITGERYETDVPVRTGPYVPQRFNASFQFVPDSSSGSSL